MPKRTLSSSLGSSQTPREALNQTCNLRLKEFVVRAGRRWRLVAEKAPEKQVIAYAGESAMLTPCKLLTVSDLEGSRKVEGLGVRTSLPSRSDGALLFIVTRRAL